METQAETRTPTIRLWNSINYVIWWLRLTMQRQTKTHIRTHPHTPHTHHAHTHTFHHFSTFMKLRISPGIHLFGVKETWFISWGLQQIVIDEETPRSTRLNVDTHFWMLEDWVLSKINVVGLEDWTFGSKGYSYWFMILEPALVRTLVHLDGDSGDCWSRLYR